METVKCTCETPLYIIYKCTKCGKSETEEQPWGVRQAACKQHGKGYSDTTGEHYLCKKCTKELCICNQKREIKDTCMQCRGVQVQEANYFENREICPVMQHSIGGSCGPTFHLCQKCMDEGYELETNDAESFWHPRIKKRQ